MIDELRETFLLLAFRPMQHTSMQSLLNCGLAGVIATAPMTAFMFVVHRFLPQMERYKLPPEIVTQQLCTMLGIDIKTSKLHSLLATGVAHFAYGGATGALYLLWRKCFRKWRGSSKGIAFGLFVWFGSYSFLLPMLGLSESIYSETALRNLMMIGAHVVWGASLQMVAVYLCKPLELSQHYE